MARYLFRYYLESKASGNPRRRERQLDASTKVRARKKATEIVAEEEKRGEFVILMTPHAARLYKQVSPLW